MKVNKEFDAEGVEGCLLIYPDFSTAVRTGKKNRYGQDIVECKDTIVAFRIYERDEDGEIKKDEKGHIIFKDYKIRHHDLGIKLLDGHFYETDKGNFLDYPDMRCYQNECEASDSDTPRLENAEG